MNKLYVILYVFIMVILSSLVSTINGDVTDFVDMSETGGDYLFFDNLENGSKKSDWDIFDGGCAMYNTTERSFSGTRSLKFEHNGSCTLANLSLSGAGLSSNITFFVRFYTEGLDVNLYVKLLNSSDNEGEVAWRTASGNNYVYKKTPDGRSNFDPQPEDNTWINFTMYFNGTHVRYTGNGFNQSLPRVFNGSPTELRLTADGAPTIGDAMWLDDFRIWKGNETDFPTEAAAGPGAPVNPSFVSPTPSNNAFNNTNQTINISHPSPNVTFYLYVNDNTFIFNETGTGPGYKIFNTNFTDGVFIYKASVQNITNGVFSQNITRTLTIDTVNPTITLGANGDNNFSTNNLTIISNYLNNLSIDISFFDINLFQTLINITNITNDGVFQRLNISITGTTANYTEIVDISKLGIGNYTINLVATDTHTAQKINDYDVKKGFNYLRYTTDEGNIIKIKSNTLPLTFKTTKLKDRYDFEFNYLVLLASYTFTIESYNKITYIPSSEYPAHFVILSENGKGNWIDFAHPSLESKDYTVTKIDDYTYEVTIASNSLKSFKFSSIGGLNRVEEDYKLRIGSVLDIWVFDDDTGLGINATATIGSQSNDTIPGERGARLVNITKETTFVTLTATGYGTEEKTISVTLNNHNLSLNMTVTSATRLSFFDEISEELIVGETFSVFLETTGFSNTFSGITDNPHTISGLGAGLYKLKASSTNYPERQYLDLNVSNTTTTLLNIYLINNTLGEEKTFSIRDVGINPLENVAVTFLRIINGTSTIVAEETSDFAGQVKLFLDPNNLYIINFSKSEFRSKTINLEPVDDVYTITLTSTTDVTTNQSMGIVYKFRPIGTVLNNNTNINFSFTLNSSFWTITNCTLRIKNGTILLSETSSFTSNSCFIRIEQNTFDMTNITSEAIYELDSTHKITVSKQYAVIFTYVGQFSLKNFLDDLSNLADAGFNDFTRFIIALITIMVIVSLVAKDVNFTNPDALMLLTWALVGFFSFIGWFRIDYQNIPNIFGLRQYIVFVLVSLVVLSFFIDKFGK